MDLEYNDVMETIRCSVKNSNGSEAIISLCWNCTKLKLTVGHRGLPH